MIGLKRVREGSPLAYLSLRLLLPALRINQQTFPAKWILSESRRSCFLAGCCLFMCSVECLHGCIISAKPCHHTTLNNLYNPSPAPLGGPAASRSFVTPASLRPGPPRRPAVRAHPAPSTEPGSAHRRGLQCRPSCAALSA
jgi:hypothetical protein